MDAEACDIIPSNISNSTSSMCFKDSVSSAFNKMGSDSRTFLNYPPAREGPAVPYKNETQVIPVFRGTPLTIGATL